MVCKEFLEVKRDEMNFMCRILLNEKYWEIKIK